ncbi:MAG: alpha/beta hydrolase [Anaerolineaceae bacterium]|nr:alpha/beta hydrolase [Anaerolineaceae bacterium]
MLLVALVIVILLVGGFVIWASTTNPLMPEAQASLAGTSLVSVTDDGFIEFMPHDVQPDTGLILYPGGKVLPGAYAPMTLSVAEEGYYAAIVYTPLNLAFFNVNAAQAVIDAHPEIEHWVVGGHSLGGVAAALFAQSNTTVEGLVLMASYPANDGLSSREDLDAVSIYGTQDGLANVTTIQDSKNLLPASAEFVAIEGGNHGQFGYYGDQSGDNPATISRDDQQSQVVAAIISLLDRVSGE